jgi:hypothetical protein
MRQTAKTGAGMQKTGNTAELVRPLPEWREKFSIIFANCPKVPASPAVKGGQPVIRPKKFVAVFT